MPKLTSSVPKGLAESGAALWSEITGTYKLRPDELRVLVDACREADWIDRLEDALVGAELTVRGSQGQPVANPLLSELRQKRQVLKSLLGSLRLPDAEGEAPSSSEAGRALVNQRWRRSS
jgi:hypothetical protein